MTMSDVSGNIGKHIKGRHWGPFRGSEPILSLLVPGPSDGDYALLKDYFEDRPRKKVYMKENLLGMGGFARVYKVTELETSSKISPLGYFSKYTWGNLIHLTRDSPIFITPPNKGPGLIRPLRPD